MNPLPSAPAEVAACLRAHLELCRDLLAVVEREAQAWRDPDAPDTFAASKTKKDLLPRLDQSLDNLRVCRACWQRLSASERANHKEVAVLMRSNQELIMKIIVLDRENEQALLRRGLVPARRLPSVNRQRPNFVANLYRRNGSV